MTSQNRPWLVPFLLPTKKMALDTSHLGEHTPQMVVDDRLHLRTVRVGTVQQPQWARHQRQMVGKHVQIDAGRVQPRTPQMPVPLTETQPKKGVLPLAVEVHQPFDVDQYRP